MLFADYERLLQDQHNLCVVHIKIRKAKIAEFHLCSLSDVGKGPWIILGLVCLVFRCLDQFSTSLQLSELLQILGICLNLEVLDAETVFFDGSDSTSTQPQAYLGVSRS
ncbi:MAG: hypothetical protein BYD32DRAFT_408579 [Podila humilis]|nr:MAG: hypothetical protein BYD32DRAFT_408579 [Podila humilis]